MWRWIKNWNCFKHLYPNICPFSAWNEFLQFRLNAAPPSLLQLLLLLLRLLPTGPKQYERENQFDQFPSTNCLLFFSADHTSRINIWLAFRRGGKYLLTLFVNLSVPLHGLCLAARSEGAGGGGEHFREYHAFQRLLSFGCFIIIIHFRLLPQAWHSFLHFEHIC